MQKFPACFTTPFDFLRQALDQGADGLILAQEVHDGC
jgi:hypothetical protein